MWRPCAGSPLGAIEAADGDLLVVEFDTGRLLRFGGAQVVTQSLREPEPYALTQSPDETVYVVESGDNDRPSGGIARLSDDGAVKRLRLVPR